MKFLLKTAALVLAMSLPAAAHDGVHVSDPYARILVGSGAVYFMMTNHADTDDVLIAASSPDAKMVSLMNSSADANGVMQMADVEGGFPVDAQGARILTGGGDHVMLMGVTRKVATGDTVTVVLTFEHAGEVTLTVPVDNQRKTPPGAGPTEFDGQATASGEDHAAAAPADHDAHMGAMSVPVGPDAEMIVATMKAMFDKPDAPLTVDPVVVSGDSAVASWRQGETGGRALLARQGDQWQIVLCGGADLRSAAFLEEHGVSDAEGLSHMFNMTEDKLGSEAVGRYSSFEGVMMIADPAHN